MRNATVTTLAPTGTISLIAGCSGGIEPLFNVIFERYTTHGLMGYFHPGFMDVAKKYKLGSKELVSIAERGTVKRSRIPAGLKEVFVTAHDVPASQHVRIQAAFQKFTDNAVSKTVNLPFEASVQDVRKSFMLAYKLRCKGLTVYRNESREAQVLRLKCPVCKV